MADLERVLRVNVENRVPHNAGCNGGNLDAAQVIRAEAAADRSDKGAVRSEAAATRSESAANRAENASAGVTAQVQLAQEARAGAEVAEHNAAVSASQAATTLAGAVQSIQDYVALRAYTGPNTTREVTTQGVAGTLSVDAGDTTSADNGGTVIVDAAGRRWKRLNIDRVSPRIFGAAGNGVTDDTAAIRAAAAYCIAVGKWLDLTDAPAGWLINGQITLTGIVGILADFKSPLLVDPAGTYARGWAVEIGDPLGAWSDGRSVGTCLLGSLNLVCLSRAQVLNGAFMKGSFLAIGHIRAYNFNGTGVRQESVHDSTTGRISAELCGSASAYALVLDSEDDTFNASIVNSVQCEQAYQKGIKIRALRSVILNVHAERLAIVSSNPDHGPHHWVELTNSSLIQGVWDCLTTGTAPDGTALAASELSMRVNLYSSCFDVNVVTGSVYSDAGNSGSMALGFMKNYTQSSPAASYTLRQCLIPGVVAPETKMAIEDCEIGVMSPGFNANNVTVRGGSVETVNYAQNVLGNIGFSQVKIGTVEDTRGVAAGFKRTSFVDCTIENFIGSFNAQAIIKGGYVHSAALASQARPEFDGTEFGAFSFTGNTGFLTRNCRGPADATWSPPLNVAYPAGTVTERVGYNAAGKLYQNTDGAANWAVLA